MMNNGECGNAILDDCDMCSGGNTNHNFNGDKDCFGDCFGSAFIDGCNYCVEGNTGLEEGYADVGCDCDNPAPLEYCEDTDGDELGNLGSEALYCLEIGRAHV